MQTPITSDVSSRAHSYQPDVQPDSTFCRFFGVQQSCEDMALLPLATTAQAFLAGVVKSFAVASLYITSIVGSPMTLSWFVFGGMISAIPGVMTFVRYERPGLYLSLSHLLSSLAYVSYYHDHSVDADSPRHKLQADDSSAFPKCFPEGCFGG